MNSGNRPGIKAVAFDLGDTLVEYGGLPLNWEAHYDSAILELARFIGCTLADAQIRAAREVLRRYNTRLNPRVFEVDFGSILQDLLLASGARFQGDSDDAATVFFSVFRQSLRSFPDASDQLKSLRRGGVRTGVLTDLPYGMPRRLVLEDMEASGVLGLVDELVTSIDSGVRKPNPRGLALLASRLKVRSSEVIFVGNEKKDVEVAIAFGCEAVLLDRNHAVPEWNQHRIVSTLAEL